MLEESDDDLEDSSYIDMDVDHDESSTNEDIVDARKFEFVLDILEPADGFQQLEGGYAEKIEHQGADFITFVGTLFYIYYQKRWQSLRNPRQLNKFWNTDYKAKTEK